ncbi:hypothetical protein CC1G_09242 [Coprinopsis cinerea okayama7|uniref:Uncharacterized protein n=1 Tax=Coprinopsis cinerea (strain Okayama-7 / 130 / ATCC MYA-4618 / FGSC 9003) TaxID=240176 RepID=A8P531_COPC7|nr:hypothetical protein CC1G_09242 [Coprinopsis cinerea okayama7\|eukprot:XP_001838865.1 hypothetical protein CC1G_09242 [Coprinopsis cinerea okayama7\
MAESLLDRAKRHLGFKPTYPSSLLPKSYLSELEKHIAQYPFDDNFTLVKQAKKGYGVLTCLEEGCNVEIPLTPLTNSRDGGKGVGLGSFVAFQTHINTHPTHKRNCLRRVAKETGQKTHSGANAHVVPARGSGMATGIKPEGQTQIDSRRVSERPVPTGPIATPLARKRHSDTAFDIDSTLEGDSSVIQVTKKLKQEASVAMIPKSPLAVKTNLAVETKPMLDADEIREQLEDVIKRHSDLEVIYDRAVRKKRKTKADQTRLNRLKLDLDALRRQKDNLKSFHPGASTSKRPLDKGDSSRSILAGPSSGNVPPTFPTSMGASHNAVQAFPAPVAGPSAGNIPMPLPMSMNAPHVANAYPPSAPAPFAYLPPPIAPFAHNAGHHRPIPPPPAAPSSAGLNPFIYYSQGQSIPQPQQQSLQQQPHQTAASVRQQHAPTIPQFGSGVAGPSQRQTLSTPTPAPGPSRILNANPMARLLGLPAPRQAPPSTVPSQSKTLKPSPAGLNPTVKREIKTEQNEVSSVASSSKVTLSPTHRLPQAFPFDPKKFADSDDDEEDFDMEYDPDMVAQNVANAAMERIGIHVAPTRDARDEDGLFYGRGRDLYEGPRANPNDINKFLLLAGNAEQFDGNASVDDALKELGLKNLDDLLPGMAVALMPHQAIGVAWMLKKEKSPLKGGCMADDMGLGKASDLLTLGNMALIDSSFLDCANDHFDDDESLY